MTYPQKIAAAIRQKRSGFDPESGATEKMIAVIAISA
jgi:hypothetical protein